MEGHSLSLAAPPSPAPPTAGNSAEGQGSPTRSVSGGRRAVVVDLASPELRPSSTSDSTRRSFRTRIADATISNLPRQRLDAAGSTLLQSVADCVRVPHLTWPALMYVTAAAAATLLAWVVCVMLLASAVKLSAREHYWSFAEGDDSICAGHAYSGGFAATAGFNSVGIGLSSTFALWYAVIAVQAEKVPYLVVFVLSAVTFVGHALFFAIRASERWATLGASNMDAARVALIFSGSLFFVAACMTRPVAQRFGWRLYGRGVANVADLGMLGQFKRLSAIARWDLLVTLNTSCAIFIFSLDVPIRIAIGVGLVLVAFLLLALSRLVRRRFVRTLCVALPLAVCIPLLFCAQLSRVIRDTHEEGDYCSQHYLASCLRGENIGQVALAEDAGALPLLALAQRGDLFPLTSNLTTAYIDGTAVVISPKDPAGTAARPTFAFASWADGYLDPLRDAAPLVDYADNVTPPINRSVLAACGVCVDTAVADGVASGRVSSAMGALVPQGRFDWELWRAARGADNHTELGNITAAVRGEAGNHWLCWNATVGDASVAAVPVTARLHAAADAVYTADDRDWVTTCLKEASAPVDDCCTAYGQCLLRASVLDSDTDYVVALIVLGVIARLVTTAFAAWHLRALMQPGAVERLDRVEASWVRALADAAARKKAAEANQCGDTMIRAVDASSKSVASSNRSVTSMALLSPRDGAIHDDASHDEEDLDGTASSLSDTLNATVAMGDIVRVASPNVADASSVVMLERRLLSDGPSSEDDEGGGAIH